MIRQRQRKTVEEVYSSSKFDASKSHVTAVQRNGGQKTNRAVERDNAYIIDCSAPHNGAALMTNLNSGKETSRRKSIRASNKIPNEKHCAKETYVVDDGKRAAIISPKKVEKFTVCDNKTYNSNHDLLQTRQHQAQHHQPHHTHRTHVHHDEDKDDDTDEFFDLIRRTVESAIGKSISELLNRNFRELSSKVDRFSAELKNTNSLLNQLQNDMGNKIGHYGEENSRHFRYLCMKSEYDKMFYQHQTIIATNKPPSNADISNETKKRERRKKSPKPSKNSSKLERKENDGTNKNDSCPCLNKKCQTSTSTLEYREDGAPSPENITPKSSEIGMREVLEQIKTFCTQRQFGGLDHVPGIEGPGPSHRRSAITKPDKFIEVYKGAFEDEDEVDDDDDEDEWEISSDGMTPRNISNDSNKSCGDTTSRGATTQKVNNGAGDG